MNKRLRSILVTLCVGVVAMVAFFIVQAVLKEGDTGEGTASTKKLTQYEVGQVASVKVELANGEYYFVTEDALNSQGGSNVAYKVTFNGVYAGLEYNATYARYVVSYASVLNATRDMGEQAQENLSVFGLETPASTITILLMDGTSKKIYIGNSAAGGLGYYCRVDGDDHVYVISNMYGEALIKSANDMRLASLQTVNSLEKLESMEWKYNGGKLIRIYRDMEPSIYNPNINFSIKEPWDMAFPANGDTIQPFIEGMTSLNILDYVTPKIDGSEVKLSDYGLDTPWGYYKIVRTDGTVIEYSFGDTVEGNSNNCYVLDHSSNQIYVIEKGTAAYVGAYDHLDLTSPYVVLANLNDIESVTAEYNGKTSIFKHKRTSSGVDENGKVVYEHSYTLDGMTYEGLVMGLLYRNAIGMRIQNEYKGAKHDEEPMLTLTFKAFDTNEPDRVISFYKINNDLCAVSINGVKNIMASVADVQDYIDAIQTVKDGGKPDYKF